MEVMKKGKKHAGEIHHLVCDICQKVYKTWAVGKKEIDLLNGKMPDVVFIHMSKGEKEVSYDICPDCFENKVMPAFDSWGAKPRIEIDLDYNLTHRERIEKLKGWLTSFAPDKSGAGSAAFDFTFTLSTTAPEAEQ